MIYKKLPIIILTMLFFISCATPVERNFTTPSGSAEVTVMSSKEDVVNYLINDFVNFGYSIKSQSPNNIVFEKKNLNNAEYYNVGLTVGNAYSTNSRISNLDLIKTSDGVRVIWRQNWQAIMIGGQINTRDITNNEVFNSNMADLNKMKNILETD